MGWASGSSLFADVITAIKDHIPSKEKEGVYTALIDAFEDEDCDTLDECVGIDPKLDKILKKRWVED